MFTNENETTAEELSAHDVEERAVEELEGLRDMAENVPNGLFRLQSVLIRTIGELHLAIDAQTSTRIEILEDQVETYERRYSL